jgi:hypothetical protein
VARPIQIQARPEDLDQQVARMGALPPDRWYHVCNGKKAWRRLRGNDQPCCKSPAVNGPKLEALVWNHLLSMANNRDDTLREIDSSRDQVRAAAAQRLAEHQVVPQPMGHRSALGRRPSSRRPQCQQDPQPCRHSSQHIPCRWPAMMTKTAAST